MDAMDAMEGLESLQDCLGYRFRKAAILRLALTHSSWSNEHEAGADHNERLEFLGDAVLELAVSTHLFASHRQAREGDLTRMRSALVNEKALAELARAIRLDESLLLSRGEEKQGGRQRDALLADALEAVFGGICLDGGFEAARQAVERLYIHRWPSLKPGSTRRKDFKTRLQEATQRGSGGKQGLPIYVQESASGPEHAKIFTVRVTLPDGRVFRAEGRGLRRAEQEAARAALGALGALEEPLPDIEESLPDIEDDEAGK